MQFVEHHASQQPNRNGASAVARISASCSGVVIRMCGRIAALTLAFRGGGIAGARLDADRQLHLRHRLLEVARNVDRQRLQRRDVERMQSALAADAAAGGDESAACDIGVSNWVRWRRLVPSPLGGGTGGGWRNPVCGHPPPHSSPHRREGADRASGEVVLNSTRLGKNPASVLPAPVGAISSTERPARAFASSSSWCARGTQPRLENQRTNGSGSVAMSARSRTVTRHS